jgi:hypothetical protein
MHKVLQGEQICSPTAAPQQLIWLIASQMREHFSVLARSAEKPKYCYSAANALTKKMHQTSILIAIFENIILPS